MVEVPVPGVTLRGVSTEEVITEEGESGHMNAGQYHAGGYEYIAGKDMVFDMDVMALTEFGAERKASMYARLNHNGIADEIQMIASNEQRNGRVRNLYNVAVGIRSR